MSLLPILASVREFNTDKPTSFDLTKDYKFSGAETKKIFDIVMALKNLKAAYDVTLRIRGNCGQIYLECKEHKEAALPPIQKTTNKV